MDIFREGVTALKVCGVTREEEARQLAEMGVEAVGFNFFRKSKRYLDVSKAVWTKGFEGAFLRVGVFVNEVGDLPLRLFGEGMVDVVQLHGDESPQDVAVLRGAGVPVIKAFGVAGEEDLKRAAMYEVDAVLLDAHAPVSHGGTGRVFDWEFALQFKEMQPDMPLVLAGGIVPGNAREAVEKVRPAALDVASGAEHSPGKKDFEKVRVLQECCEW